MRVIGYVEHPTLKISVFKNEGRTSVKFETALYEQIFKLGDDERYATLEGVQKWVDAAFLVQVNEVFQRLHHIRLEANKRAFPVQDGQTFEEII